MRMREFHIRGWSPLGGVLCRGKPALHVGVSGMVRQHSAHGRYFPCLFDYRVRVCLKLTRPGFIAHYWADFPGTVHSPLRTGLEPLSSSGSHHPAARTALFCPLVPPLRLTTVQNWMTRPLRSPPITGVSSLLRVIPPLYFA